MRNRAALAALAGALVLAGLPAGGNLFEAGVLVLAVLTLTEMALALAGAGQRMVVPGAAIPALGGPLWFATARGAGWDAVPAAMAAGVIGTFVLTMLVPRSRTITAVVGTTLFAGLLVGMGCVALLLLRGQEAGFHWVLALLLLTWSPQVAAEVARLAGLPATGVHGARVVTCGAIAGALVAVADPPLSVVPSLALSAVALLAVWAADALGRGVALEASSLRPSGRDAGGALPGLTVLPWLLAPLVAAPGTGFLVMAAQA